MLAIMEKKTGFSTFINWLGTSEMFARPSKRLPGKWLLFEYYIDTEDKLQNYKEARLKENKMSLNLEFREDGKFFLESNLPVAVIQNMEAVEWSVTKNFITLIDPYNFRNNVEFQFAFEKNTLKLLKKDKLGKIEFFGFFKSIDK